jgi:DNA-binding transcriptional MerR regulator
MFQTVRAPIVQTPLKRFSSSQVSKITALTLRKIQYLDEREVVSPQHVGHSRHYTEAEVLELLILHDLRGRGMSLKKATASIVWLRRRESNAKSYPFLITDGESRYLLNEDEAIRRLARCMSGTMLVNLSDLRHIVSLAAEKYA